MIFTLMAREERKEQENIQLRHLLLRDDISFLVRSDIEKKFMESNLPFLVEVIAWKNMRSPLFKKPSKKI
jgi:hypothetical protein